MNATPNPRVVTTQDSLKSAGDDVMSATDALESDLKDLGKPDTQSGQEAKDSMTCFRET